MGPEQLGRQILVWEQCWKQFWHHDSLEPAKLMQIWLLQRNLVWYLSIWLRWAFFIQNQVSCRHWQPGHHPGPYSGKYLLTCPSVHCSCTLSSSLRAFGFLLEVSWGLAGRAVALSREAGCIFSTFTDWNVLGNNSKAVVSSNIQCYHLFLWFMWDSRVKLRWILTGHSVGTAERNLQSMVSTSKCIKPLCIP